MIGNEHSGPGVMVLTMREIFNIVQSTQAEKKYKVAISYLEVYNETIRDLFVKNSKPLMLCEDSDGGVRVADLSERYPESAEEVRNQSSSYYIEYS
jgi:kinesin family protein 18/19